METRILYQIQTANGEVLATLGSNCSATLNAAEEQFQAGLRRSQGPTSLLQILLSSRYPVAEGNHRRGDRMFWLVAASEIEAGDHEQVLVARAVVKDAEEVEVSHPSALWSVFDSEALAS